MVIYDSRLGKWFERIHVRSPQKGEWILIASGDVARSHGPFREFPILREVPPPAHLCKPPLIPDEEARELVSAFKENIPDWRTGEFGYASNKILQRIALRLEEQDAPELKRCVCGRECVATYEEARRRWTVSCVGPGASQCPYESAYYPTREDAIEVHNAAMRAAKEEDA